eukprot:1433914-Prymnesium_polylepis.1
MEAVRGDGSCIPQANVDHDLINTRKVPPQERVLDERQALHRVERLGSVCVLAARYAPYRLEESKHIMVDAGSRRIVAQRAPQAWCGRADAGAVSYTVQAGACISRADARAEGTVRPAMGGRGIERHV